jgi:hypothetical protein
MFCRYTFVACLILYSVAIAVCFQLCCCFCISLTVCVVSWLGLFLMFVCVCVSCYWWMDTWFCPDYNLLHCIDENTNRARESLRLSQECKSLACSSCVRYLIWFALLCCVVLCFVLMISVSSIRKIRGLFESLIIVIVFRVTFISIEIVLFILLAI